MSCKLCASHRQTQLGAEMNLHFCGLTNLDKPSVFVFPEVSVCLDCGFSDFTIAEDELSSIIDGARTTPSGRRVPTTLSLGGGILLAPPA
jgi:hypothetical protein